MNASNSRYCNCIYFASGALARKVEKLAVDTWKETNLAPSHAYLLMIVLDKPGVQPTALVEELLLAPSTITRLIEKLEQKKLVRRTMEGKITNVFPTTKAKSMRAQLRGCVDKFYENVSGILGKEETSRMVHQINRITDKI
jgi:DNA-binding MarR family transcriptional regulator